MDLPLAFAAQLSQHLRALRKANHWSQVELASRMGVAQSRIANLEKDASKLTAEQLLKLLSVLGAQLVIKAPDLAADSQSSVPDAGGAKTSDVERDGPSSGEPTRGATPAPSATLTVIPAKGAW